MNFFEIFEIFEFFWIFWFFWNFWIFFWNFWNFLKFLKFFEIFYNFSQVMKSFPPNLRGNQTDWQNYQSEYLNGSWGIAFWGWTRGGKRWWRIIGDWVSPSFETTHQQRLTRKSRRQRAYHYQTSPILSCNPETSKKTKYRYCICFYSSRKPIINKWRCKFDDLGENCMIRWNE